MVGERIRSELSGAVCLIESWASGTANVFDQEGAQSAAGWSLVSPIGHLYRAGYPDPFRLLSESIYENDWDLLVILDGCRVDLMREVASEYTFINVIDTKYSLGTDSTEWIQENFVNEPDQQQLTDTCYITGNPHTELALTKDDLGYLDEVWKYEFDYEKGIMPPRPITDRAIAAGRNSNFDRYVIHYMQPHFPSIPQLHLGSTMNPENVGDEWNSIWDRLEQGEVSKQVVWDAYRENLRYILDEIEILLENFQAENTIISADHGNAIGEFGFYGHPRVPIRPIRKVPWCNSSANDEKTIQSEITPPESDSLFNRNEQLQALGYK